MNDDISQITFIFTRQKTSNTLSIRFKYTLNTALIREQSRKRKKSIDLKRNKDII